MHQLDTYYCSAPDAKVIEFKNAETHTIILFHHVRGHLNLVECTPGESGFAPCILGHLNLVEGRPGCQRHLQLHHKQKQPCQYSELKAHLKVLAYHQAQGNSKSEGGAQCYHTQDYIEYTETIKGQLYS